MSLKIPGSVQNRGPCDMGFHIPTQQEFGYVVAAMARGTGHSTSYADLEQDYFTYLHFPNVGYLGRADGNRVAQYGNCRYWTCTAYSSSSTYCFLINEKYTQGSITVTTDKPANAFSIRAFADSFVYPDSSWTTLLDQNDVTIAWNSSKKLISIIDSLNNKYITMQDRNVGATVRWDNGDTLTDNNVGLFFQWGNNYGWPLSGPTAFTGTIVSFGQNPPTPENPYYDNHFVATSSNYWFTASSTPSLKIWGGYPSQAGYPLMVEPINITYKVATGVEVWHNPTLGLYSFTKNGGNTWTTIADKDLGANRVGQEGNLFQWGNDYGFPATGTVSRSTAVVNVDNYGPGNHYNTSTWTRATGTIYSTTYSASSYAYGKDLWGGTTNTVIARQGPCPEGWHVPSNSEFSALLTCAGTLPSIVCLLLHLPYAGSLYYGDATTSNQGITVRYWTSDGYQSGKAYALTGNIVGGTFTSENSLAVTYNTNLASGFSIRPFYNTGVVPDSSQWNQILYNGNKQIWHSTSMGMISFTNDGGTTWTTMSDKNLGATEIWNNGDTMTQANCGYYFQRGNNYGFPFDGQNISTTTALVSAGGYGPGNYYSSSNFVTTTANPATWLANPILNLRGRLGTTEDRRGPCPEGFHVPTRSEFSSISSNISGYLSFISAGHYRYSTAGSAAVATGTSLRRYSCESANNNSAYSILRNGQQYYSNSMYYQYYIRPFKDVPVVPSVETGWYRTYQGISTKTVNQVYQGSTQVRPPATTKLLLNHYTASVGVGRTLNLDEILFPLASKDSVTRTSSDTNIATVSSTGTVTGVALGTCTITAEISNNLFTTCDIVVNNVPDYLCFTANTGGSTVRLQRNGAPAEVSLETSTDKSTWTAYNFNGTTGDLITLANVGDVVYFRNTSTTTTNFGLSGVDYYRFAMTGSIAASGSVNYLLNKNHTETLPCDYVFYRLFENCQILTSCPQLPATKLTQYCYYNMFQSCRQLTTLPILPAAMLPPNCYYYMFNGCSQIKLSSTQTGDYQTPYRIPTIGTGVIGSNSLNYMFQNTGGTFTGNPSINTTYYTSNSLVY